MEYVGSICQTNHWIKLGMMKEELVALKHIARLFKHSKNRTSANALYLVVTTALLHWDKLEEYVFSDQAYSEAEGFFSTELFRQAGLRRKFPDLKDARSNKSQGKKAGHFFQVCMSKREQNEMRAMARECGTELRTVVYNALHGAKRELEHSAKIQRITGTKPDLRESLISFMTAARN